MRQMPSIETVKAIAICKASLTKSKTRQMRNSNTPGVRIQTLEYLATSCEAVKAFNRMPFTLFQFRTLDQQAYCLLGPKLSLNRNRQHHVDKSRTFSSSTPAYKDSQNVNE